MTDVSESLPVGFFRSFPFYIGYLPYPSTLFPKSGPVEIGRESTVPVPLFSLLNPEEFMKLFFFQLIWDPTVHPL